MVIFMVVGEGRSCGVDPFVLGLLERFYFLSLVFEQSNSLLQDYSESEWILCAFFLLNWLLNWPWLEMHSTI